jgi:Putative rRNA methylase
LNHFGLGLNRFSVTRPRPFVMRGLLLPVLYSGHEGGAEEAEAMRDFASGIPTRKWHVTGRRTLNAHHPPPAVLAIEKAAGQPEAGLDWEI